MAQKCHRCVRAVERSEDLHNGSPIAKFAALVVTVHSPSDTQVVILISGQALE